MKICPRRPLKVPKDFGTRLAPIDPTFTLPAYGINRNAKEITEFFYRTKYRFWDKPEAKYARGRDPCYYKNDPTYNL